jgi:hypothetical protein
MVAAILFVLPCQAPSAEPLGKHVYDRDPLARCSSGFKREVIDDPKARDGKAVRYTGEGYFISLHDQVRVTPGRHRFTVRLRLEGGGHMATDLEVGGEDALTVDRKFLGSVTLKLPTRFAFWSNELPMLSESSGALAGRFLVLKFTQSFYGREDPFLTARLLEELPGTLKWAIEGWHQFRADGRFIEPASSRAAIEELEDLLSPVGAFLRERCVVGPQYRCHLRDLRAAWARWCLDNGRDHPGTVQSFGRDLAAAVPNARTRRNHATGTRLRTSGRRTCRIPHGSSSLRGT